MKELHPVSLDAAAEVLDFGGGGFVSAELAREQLKGAVAVHGMLAREGVAYLADEVGLGKTYVALGAIALMRRAKPDLRVLYVAPRENIQVKWLKEVRNFTRNCWKDADQRVKSLQGTSTRELVASPNLIAWAHEALLHPDRDFFLRLTSFSLGMSDEDGFKRKKAKQLARLSAVAPPFLLDGRLGKAQLKQNAACWLNALIPSVDLVVVDEAHALKAGLQSGAARNRLLSLILGTAEDAEELGLERRADRALLLSATPLEGDFAQLWNQLRILGHGEGLEALADPRAGREEKRALASRVLLRRITCLDAGDERLTKNQYRREWRAGGCAIHDEPLAVPDERQRLIVALVQSKVSDTLQEPRFGARFQVGMLASFESFLETAKRTSADEAVFDGSDQTDDEVEKEGIDSVAVSDLARSYRETFGESLPHPKMDSVVESLAADLPRAEKTLVFVRRVRSVSELAEKLCRRHDAWLQPRLRELVGEDLAPEIDRLFARHRAEAGARGWEELVKGGRHEEDEEHVDTSEVEEAAELADEDDLGSRETFFSWFFRGAGPSGVLSGAAFRRNRLDSESAALSTFFEDDHVGDILGWPKDVVAALAEVAARPRAELAQELRGLAFSLARHDSKAQRLPRRRTYLAYQEAALRILESSRSRLQDRARVVRQALYPGASPVRRAEVPAGFPRAEDFLGTRTFFTELRRRPALREEIWPRPVGGSDDERLRDSERRRELLSAVVRLGHPLVELWSLAIRRLGGVELQSLEQDEDGAEGLIDDYLDLLEGQRAGQGLTSWRELSLVGRHHELILNVNFPQARDAPLGELAKLYGSPLQAQTPIAGVSGAVNSRAVRQFRMPGYPLVLISTDVLQEGEDLHLFCSKVVHYGITWTPSAMEQRTGRVDRISSLTHRRLTRLEPGQRADPEKLLQVYYPYLEDTVEVLQVDRVLERMNRFLELMHEGFDTVEGDKRIDTRTGMLAGRRRIPQLEGRLETAFPVLDQHLEGGGLPGPAPGSTRRDLLGHLQHLAEELSECFAMDWEPPSAEGATFGRVFVREERLLKHGEERRGEGTREQPIRLELRTHGATGQVLLHLESPAGPVELAAWAEDLVRWQSELDGMKLCAHPTSRQGTHDLSVEADLFFSPELTQLGEVASTLTRVAVAADVVESELEPGRDRSVSEYRAEFQGASDD